MNGGFDPTDILAGIDSFIFDFDGTLAYSEAAYRASFQHAIRLHTGLEVSDDEFRRFWNRNLTPEDILRCYGEEMLEEMLVSFEEHYYANHHHHLTPYEGVMELVEALVRRKARLAVVSLKPRRAGERELAITGLQRYIHTHVWGDDVERPKPEVDGVLRALEEIGGEARRSLVIGDSVADLIMGRAAGARTAAALWGGGNRERLLGESPDLMLNRPGDLLEWIEAAFPARTQL